MGLTDLPANLWKVTLDKKVICNSYRKCKGGNRDYYRHFLVIFQTIGKSVIVFVRLILENVGLTDLLNQDRTLT